MALSENGAGWLYALTVTFIFSFIGLVIPNALRNAKKSRPHNVLKFWNEFLARHQLAYLTYYLAIFFTATFVTGFKARAVSVPFALTLATYFVGVNLSTNYQDDYLKKRHGRRKEDDDCEPECDKLTKAHAVGLLWPNVLFAILANGLVLWSLTKIA